MCASDINNCERGPLYGFMIHTYNMYWCVSVYIHVHNMQLCMYIRTVCGDLCTVYVVGNVHGTKFSRMAPEMKIPR